jgi:hypothetical protein
MSNAAHAPHKVNSVYIDATGKFFPVGVDTTILRAEECYENDKGKLILVLSDFYADEYHVNMGPSTTSMRAFVGSLTSVKRFCHVVSHTVNCKSGKSFFKPVVKAAPLTVTSFFNLSALPV